MRIVCTTDLSTEALAAARLADVLAYGFGDGDESVSLEFLHVVKKEWFRLDRGRPSPVDDPDNAARLEQEVRKWSHDELHRDDYDVALREGKPSEEIAEYIEETDTDVLVMAQTGSGFFARLQLGSTVHKLAQSPPCNLFIAHRSFSGFQPPRRIVVAVDMAEVSGQAVETAAELARAMEAELNIVHVYDAPRPATYPGGLLGHPITDDDVEIVQRQVRIDLREFVRHYDDALDGLSVTTNVLMGAPTRRIIEHAKHRKADVLCMGTVSQKTVERMMLGSVASGVVRHMPCTMLLVPPRNPPR